MIKDLRSELIGDFKNVVFACFIPPDEFYAKELYDAMSGLNIRVDTLIEILCTLNNAWILSVKKVYEQSTFYPFL
jgi:hypothetical protein